jgi:hypothetical protein
MAQVPRPTGQVFTRTSFTEPALSAVSQAGLVNGLNDGLVAARTSEPALGSDAHLASRLCRAADPPRKSADRRPECHDERAFAG